MNPKLWRIHISIDVSEEDRRNIYAHYNGTRRKMATLRDCRQTCEALLDADIEAMCQDQDDDGEEVSA